MEITTYKEAIKILRRKGVKLALQTKHDSYYVYAEKNDFIAILKDRMESGYNSEFCDYDGNIESVIFSEGVLSISAGIS